MIKRKVEAWNADPISLRSARRQEGPLYPFSGRVCYSISFHMEKFLAWHRCWKLCLSFFTFLTYSSVRCTRQWGVWHRWLSSRLQEYGEWVDNKMTKCSTEGKNICSAKAWFSICRRCGRLLGIYARCLQNNQASLRHAFPLRPLYIVNNVEALELWYNKIKLINIIDFTIHGSRYIKSYTLKLIMVIGPSGFRFGLQS